MMKAILQLWNSWIFLSQNFSLCLPCICCLTLRRIKQFSNVFVLKMSLKNAHFVWKMAGLFWAPLYTPALNYSWTHVLLYCKFIIFKGLLQAKGLHLVYFISNAVKKRLVSNFPSFHSRCLFLLLNFAKFLDRRCLFFYAFITFSKPCASHDFL